MSGENRPEAIETTIAFVNRHILSKQESDSLVRV